MVGSPNNLFFSVNPEDEPPNKRIKMGFSLDDSSIVHDSAASA